MKYTIISLAIILLGLLACKKEASDDDGMGTIVFMNVSDDLYKVEITLQGELIAEAAGFIYGGIAEDFEVPIGTYTYKLTQQDGYILWPTIIEETIVITDRIPESVFFP